MRPMPHVVVVAAGEHAGPGGRAQRGGVEAGVAQPAGGQRVEVRAWRCRSRSSRAARSPTSSSTTSSTLGAPSGGRGSGGHHASDSQWYRPIRPSNSPGFHRRSVVESRRGCTAAWRLPSSAGASGRGARRCRGRRGGSRRGGSRAGGGARRAGRRRGVRRPAEAAEHLDRVAPGVPVEQQRDGDLQHHAEQEADVDAVHRADAHTAGRRTRAGTRRRPRTCARSPRGRAS